MTTSPEDGAGVENLGLEAVHRPQDGMPEIDAQIRVFESARDRVAKIEKYGNAAGTGVLVGPDLLLTAFHVLGHDTDLPSVDGVVAIFDFINSAHAMTPAETGMPVGVAAYLDGSPPRDEELQPSALISSGVTSGAQPPRLDFALLRLEDLAPGTTSKDGSVYPRGFYTLSTNMYSFDSTALLYAVQHPMGGPMRVTPVTQARLNQATTRVQYMTNTLKGSSGSPIINPQGRLVAIHHFSEGLRGQGIPIYAIAAAIHNGPMATELQQGGTIASTAVPSQAPRSPRPLTLADYEAFTAMRKYEDADEALYWLCGQGDAEAVCILVGRLRSLGRYQEAAELEQRLILNRPGLPALVRRIRNSG